MRRKILKVGSCEAEEDFITKTHCSSKCFFLFCKFIKSGKCTRTFLSNAGDVLGGTNHIPSFLQLCQKSLEFPKNAVGENAILLVVSRFREKNTFYSLWAFYSKTLVLAWFVLIVFGGPIHIFCGPSYQTLTVFG